MASHKEPLAREHLGYQLLYALQREPLGRRTLVQRTGLTESVVRTELEKLAAQGLVSFAKPGTALTPKGDEISSELFTQVVQVEELALTELKLDQHNRAALIRAAAEGLRSWQLRDLAVREGATGTLFLVRRAKYLSLLDEDRPLARQNPRDARRLEYFFKSLQTGDLIVIVFAPLRAQAGAGLWRIISEIVPICERSLS
jgi:predicted transcriptional regulator